MACVLGTTRGWHLNGPRGAARLRDAFRGRTRLIDRCSDRSLALSSRMAHDRWTAFVAGRCANLVHATSGQLVRVHSRGRQDETLRELPVTSLPADRIRLDAGRIHDRIRTGLEWLGGSAPSPVREALLAAACSSPFGIRAAPRSPPESMELRKNTRTSMVMGRQSTGDLWGLVRSNPSRNPSDGIAVGKSIAVSSENSSKAYGNSRAVR
jgi:hypothetical protein